MGSATEQDSGRNRSAALFRSFGRRTRRGKSLYAFNFLIIISIVFYGTNTLSGKTSNIRGVQIELGDGNRVCMSFDGKIKGIIIKGGVNLPGETFEHITKVGDTQISRSYSGMLTRIGRLGIHRDWHGNIVKIGDAEVLRNKYGSIIAVNGDPYVSPLFAVEPP